MRLTEKHRPKNLDEIKGQPEVVESIKRMLKRDDLPHMLFLGPPGCGKTSMAECITRSLFGENWRNYYIELNASDERGIDTIRDTVKRIARMKGRRILFLDEADNMTTDAQQALRRIMEKTTGTIFILSGNMEHKIIDAIKSRCAIFRFKRLKDEDVLRRLLEVCKDEGIEITKEGKEGFIALVKESKGDLRKALNMLETMISEGKEISAKNVLALREPQIAGDALKFALHGDFDKGRELLEDAYISANFNTEKIIEEFYNCLNEIHNDPKMSDVGIRLYVKLAEVERAIKLGANPLIQFVSFIAFVYVAPHLSKCPALERSE